MKSKAILSAALAAFMTLSFGAALAQEACNNEYAACMTACASRTVKAGQETCFSNCEAKNGLCSERIYGRRPFNGGANANAQASAPAKDAMAKEAPPRAGQEPAAEQEPAPPPARR